MVAELFHADRRTDGMTKLIVIICKCATIYISGGGEPELKKIVGEIP